MKISCALRRFQSLVPPLLAALLSASCASSTPVALTTARTTYRRASSGPAAQYAPAELHKAKVALDKAERSYSEVREPQATVNLSYAAESLALNAEAVAARTIAAQKAKVDEDGTVITLSGSALFGMNDTTLLPSAELRLNQVAEALVAKGRAVVVEGHTDSWGSQESNVELSLGRAESVRAYLVSRGVPGASISARGLGPDRPVADNNSAEGRANNRRVEIVVAKNEASSH